jgi:FdhD protein
MNSATAREVAVRRHVLGRDPWVDRDAIAVEEPLEIRVSFRRKSLRVTKTVSVTMRTPGDDEDLALGFLSTEGIVQRPQSVLAISIEPERGDSVLVSLDAEVDLTRLERHFYTTSSCGVCGKTSLDALRMNRAIHLPPDRPTVTEQTVAGLGGFVRERQQVFASTGGLHAAALLSSAGQLLNIREDVGRHNAVDKLIGAELRAGREQFADLILFVSGRAGFELMQKAIMTGISVMVAVGAPTSLAVQLAREYDATLIGFARNQRFNVYSGFNRCAPAGCAIDNLP